MKTGLPAANADEVNEPDGKGILSEAVGVTGDEFC
jgi:hypothetical protein